MNETILKQEIEQQPEAIRSLISRERKDVESLVAQLRGRFNHVVIAARGTSDNAARYAQYLLGAHNHLPVALATPSLFTIYDQPPKMTDSLVIGISQSGRPPDIVAVLEEGRRQGQPTLAITNQADSPLAKAAEYLIQLKVGQERSVAATKTYTATLAALALLSGCLNGDAGALEALEKVPDYMQQVLQDVEGVHLGVQRYRYMDHCVVIGRGFNYATAFEISLKIKELTQIIAEPYSSADFLHGPIAIIREGFPVLMVAPSGPMLADLKDLIERIIEMHSELVLISDVPEILERAHLAMQLPGGIPEWLSPMVAVLPGQVFSLALAQARGLDPDQPKGLHKVTETW
jgi:glucosamine--fructose-6-phosphate aminotransferase (isomerizing)